MQVQRNAPTIIILERKKKWLRYWFENALATLWQRYSCHLALPDFVQLFDSHIILA